MTNEEQRFHDDLIRRLDKARDELAIDFKKMREAIATNTAVGAAKYFISPDRDGKLHEGLLSLARVNRTNLSLEQAVIDFKDEGLFTDAEVASARARLYYANQSGEK